MNLFTCILFLYKGHPCTCVLNTTPSYVLRNLSLIIIFSFLYSPIFFLLHPNLCSILPVKSIFKKQFSIPPIFNTFFSSYYIICFFPFINSEIFSSFVLCLQFFTSNIFSTNLFGFKFNYSTKNFFLKIIVKQVLLEFSTI